MTKYRPFIVCSAIRRNSLIVCGARHFDDVMRAQIKAANLPYTNWEQGFIDQRGNFLTREESWLIAQEAGQIKFRCGGDGEKLFSENLY